MRTNNPKKAMAILLRDHEKTGRLHTEMYDTLAEKVGVELSTMRQIVSRYPKGLVRVSYDAHKRAHLQVADVELAIKYMDGKYPSKKKKRMEIGTGELSYIQHHVKFKCQILGSEKSKVEYHYDSNTDTTKKKWRGGRKRSAKVRLFWLVDSPDSEVTIDNYNSKTLVVHIPEIKFHLDDPKTVEDNNLFVSELMVKVRYHLQHLGFVLGDIQPLGDGKEAMGHYVVPQEQYAELLQRKSVKVSENEWIDFSPKEYDEHGQLVPMRETTSEEVVKRILTDEKEKREIPEKLDYLQEHLEVFTDLDTKEGARLEEKAEQILEVTTQGRVDSNKILNMMAMQIASQEKDDPLEDLREMQKIPEEDDEGVDGSHGRPEGHEKEVEE